MEVTTIGIDLAKSAFAVSGADRSGRVVMRRQLRRTQVLSFMRGLPRCTVGMEASGGAQYWARQLTALGHEVRLMSPGLVMPYRKGNKTDRNDADAILEAVTRPSMRFVTVKSVAQQDLLALHRVRAQLVKSRTALCNQLRGLLRERGVVVRVGVAGLKRTCRRRWRMRGANYPVRCASCWARWANGCAPSNNASRAARPKSLGSLSMMNAVHAWPRSRGWAR